LVCERVESESKATMIKAEIIFMMDSP